MGNRWRRWRGFMDELEEVARVCAGQIAAAEKEIANHYERSSWTLKQRQAVPLELVRRGLDIPFLADLIRAAWSVGPDADLVPPDDSFRPWPAGRAEHHRPSGVEPTEEPAPDVAGDAPPARLRLAERALAARTRSIAVVLDRVTNPRNVSAVMRTAEVLGHQEVHVIRTEGRERMMRSISTGAERFLDVTWYKSPADALDGLRRRGYRVLAADHGPGAVPLEEVPLGRRIAVVLGSEQAGVSAEARDAADGLFYIPTPGFTSYLNVSVAAALSLAGLDRRMRREDRREPLPEVERAALRRRWYAALAGKSPDLQRRYLAWAERPPEPAPGVKPVPSREKRDAG